MEMSVRRLILGMALVASVHLAWPVAAPSAAQTGPYSISRVVAARNVENGQPSGIAALFKPDVGSICIWFQGTAAPRDLVVRSEWYINDAHVTDASYDLTIKKGADVGYISLALPPGTPFPEGVYRVDLTVQDLVLATHKFEVRATATAASGFQPSGGAAASATTSSSPAAVARPASETTATQPSNQGSASARRPSAAPFDRAAAIERILAPRPPAQP